MNNDYDSALQGWFSRPADDAAEPDPMGTGKKSPEHVQALDQVREWTRDRFKLAADAAILVSEVACMLPGCPPLETVVAFWENDNRYHFKLFKPVTKVAEGDLPFAWLKDTLVVPEGFECECC